MGTLAGTWIGNDKLKAEIYNHKKFKLVNVNNEEPKIINLVFMCFNVNNNVRHQVYNYFNNKEWVSNLCQKKTGKYLNDDIFMNIVILNFHSFYTLFLFFKRILFSKILVISLTIFSIVNSLKLHFFFKFFHTNFFYF